MMTKQFLNLIICLPYHHSASPSACPLPLTCIFPFFVGTRGSSLWKCTEVWPTKHKAHEDRGYLEEYEEHEKGHESTLKVKDALKGRARYGARWQSRNWKDFTHLYTSMACSHWQSQNVEPCYKLRQLWATCDMISPHRGKTGQQEASCVNGHRRGVQIIFLCTARLARFCCHISWNKSFAMDPLWWCGKLRHPSSHCAAFAGSSFFFFPLRSLCA